MDVRAQREAERIARWAERQTNAAVASPAPKVTGAAAHLTDDERRLIWNAYLDQLMVSGRRPTYVSLAAEFGRDRETIAACLKTTEFEEYKARHFGEVRSFALDQLRALIPEAVEAFRVAIPAAAEKGDVRPAEKALLYTETVQPIGDGANGPSVIVQIGVKREDVQVNVGALPV